MTMVDPQCAHCIHFDDSNPGSIPRCTAFPDGIPGYIILNRWDHREHVPGDNGILFTPREGDRSPIPEGRNVGKTPESAANERRRTP